MNSRHNRLLGTVCALALLGAGSGSLASPQSQGDRLVWEWADSARVESADGRTVRTLFGNIRFRQGNAFLNCDQAIWHVESGILYLRDNVYVSTGRRHLYADRVIFNERTRVEEAMGNVVLFDSTWILRGDEVTYFENDERALARGYVVLEDTSRFITLFCGQIQYQREGGYAVAWRSPLLISTDSTRSDSIRLTGKKMEVFDSLDLAVVTDSVRIVRTSLTATCGRAEYFIKGHKIVLSEGPHARRKYDDLSGERFELSLDETEIDTVSITGDALITSPADTLHPEERINRLSGQKVTVKLRDEQIQTILINGQGTSLYHLIEEGEFRGINTISGDVIRMSMANGELTQILIESTPGRTEGTYYPPRLEHLAKMNAQKQRKKDVDKVIIEQL